MENCLSPATLVSLYGRMYTGSNLVTLTQNQEREISLIRSSRKSQLDKKKRRMRVDVLWGELEWSSPTDDDELPEVTGPAWIVDKVAHYGG